MRIATLNVQNLRLRRVRGVARLDGARDGDEALPADIVANTDHDLDAIDRSLTAQLIALANADVIALQEVFDQETLDYFHDELLTPLGANYPHRVCLEGNDGRSVDVAVMSKFPLEQVQSHAALTFADIGVRPPAGTHASARVFRRDCLMVSCAGLDLFVCHLKAVMPGDVKGRAIRQAEAEAIRQIIDNHVSDAAPSNWLVLGDFNAHRPDNEADLAPFVRRRAVDLCSRMPFAERWTFFHRSEDHYSCPDRIFASQSLAATCPNAIPKVMRNGLPQLAAAYQGDRFSDVGLWRPHSSDHALLFVDIEIEGLKNKNA